MVRVCEVDGSVEFLCDVFVVGELGTAIGSDGEDVFRERLQHLHHQPCHGLGILAFGGPGHKEFLGGTLRESQNDTLAVLSDDGIHLPVAETRLGIYHGVPFVCIDAASNRHRLVHRPATVLEDVREIPVQVVTIRLVPADEGVYPLMGHTGLPKSSEIAAATLRGNNADP